MGWMLVTVAELYPGFQPSTPCQPVHALLAQLDLLPASFDVLTCSAALPFLPAPSTALAAWRTLLRPPRGRLALNSFVAPAVVDFGTFREVAAAWGVPVVDPCEAVGSEELLKDLLLGAGFSSVQVRRGCCCVWEGVKRGAW